MSLFKKKTVKEEVPKVENKANNTNEIEMLDLGNEKIETLDLSGTDTNTNEQKEVTVEDKKENKTILIIVFTIVIAGLLIPTLSGLFSHSSVVSINRQLDEITENKTIDGMIEIGKTEGSITAKKIQFYNFTKDTNNQIKLLYLPQTAINDIENLNIYIELYNSNKKLIYRVKYSPTGKLERKIQKNYSITVNPTTYKDAKYGKIVIIRKEDFKEGKDALKCTYRFNELDYNVSYEINYSFGDNGLTKYSVKREIEKNETVEGINNDESNQVLKKYQEKFETEAKSIEDTNIKNLEQTENSLSYTVDLLTLDLQKSTYEKLYELGSAKRQIKIDEEAKSWSCE